MFHGQCCVLFPIISIPFLLTNPSSLATRGHGLDLPIHVHSNGANNFVALKPASRQHASGEAQVK
jgi:hypothetical protein